LNYFDRLLSKKDVASSENPASSTSCNKKSSEDVMEEMIGETVLKELKDKKSDKLYVHDVMFKLIWQ
jgi:hypothetical protein